MAKAVRFTNFSKEDFVGVWDKDLYPIGAGQSEMLQEYLAIHFAKHLIDREMNRMDILTNNQSVRDDMSSKCIGKVIVEAENETKLSQKMLNAEEPKEKVKDKSESKPEKPETSSEDEFEGLKTKATTKPENTAKDTTKPTTK